MNSGRNLAQLSDCLKGQVPINPDWTGILGLANKAFVTPELCQSLATSNLPDDVNVFLDEVCRRNSARNQSLFSTLCEATAALNFAGIDPILLKGCAAWSDDTTRYIIPNGDRIISDLDLVITLQESRSAVEALVSAGFDVVEDHSSDDDHVVAILSRSGDAGTIDLHYRAPCPTGIYALDALHKHSEQFKVGSGNALVPRPELQVLIGALHDLVHDAYYWLGDFNLRHLLDTKKLLERDDFDWDFLDRVCANSFIRAMTTLQLRCAHEIVGADVPKRWLSSLTAHAHYRRMRLQYELSWLRPPLAWFGHLIKWRESPARKRVAAAA